MWQLHLLIIQRGVGYIVIDADGEAVLGLGLVQVVIHSGQHSGGNVLGGQTVAASHHLDVGAASLVEGGAHVQIEGLAHRADFLAAVQNSDLLAGRWNGFREVLHREGTEQMDLHHAHLAAVSVEIIHSLLQGLGSGAHHHNDLFCVVGTVVVEQLVVPAGDGVDLVHVVLDGVGHAGTLDVGALLALKVDVGVDVVAPVGRMLGVERVAAELLHRLLVQQAAQIFVVQHLDPLHLMGGAEGVLGTDGGQMGNRTQIHGLLGRRRHEHAVTGGAAGHKVGVVAENGVVVGGHHPGGDVDDAGEKLTAHGIHGGDHQHQALRRCESGSQSTGLKGTVAGTGGAGLRLHLDHIHGGAEEVLPSPLGPFVHLLRHGRRWCDRVDGGHLGERIGHMGRSSVAVHHGIVFFHRIVHLQIFCYRKLPRPFALGHSPQRVTRSCTPLRSPFQ